MPLNPAPPGHGVTMCVYRVARITAAIAGMSLAIVAGTTEAVTATAEIQIVSGFRAWMVTLILIAALSVCTGLIIERQERIIDLLNARSTEDLARGDYTNIERRLRSNGNVTTLYSDEE